MSHVVCRAVEVPSDSLLATRPVSLEVTPLNTPISLPTDFPWEAIGDAVGLPVSDVVGGAVERAAGQSTRVRHSNSVGDAVGLVTDVYRVADGESLQSDVVVDAAGLAVGIARRRGRSCRWC